MIGKSINNSRVKIRKATCKEKKYTNIPVSIKPRVLPNKPINPLKPFPVPRASVGIISIVTILTFCGKKA